MSNLMYSSNIFFNKYIEFIKEMSFNCIVKDEELADSFETLEINTDATNYIACIEGRFSLQDILEEIPREILLLGGMQPHEISPYYGMFQDDIPVAYKDRVLKEYRKYIIDIYVERNNYYRMIAGLPNFEDDSVMYKGKPIERYSIGELTAFNRNGIIDNLKQLYPDVKYLNHLGDRMVPVYNARRSQKFQLLYVPTIEDTRIYNRFREIYERNRVYTMRRIYSDAFKFNSKEYDHFIALFILIQTISDMFVSIPDIIIRKEFFDDVSIRDMFLSHDITYFSEIPRRYQMNMILHLNELLNNKSTNKCIIDICKLFGFDNIQVFKYYMLKDRKILPNGEYAEEKYINKNGERILDLESMYDLKFLKIPIEDNVDDHILDKTIQTDYESITLNDPYWLPEDSLYKEFKYQLLEEDFNYELTKYLSVDLLYDLNKLINEMVYFFNMVFDYKELEENLELKIPYINSYSYFKLTDILCFLYALMYRRLNIEDVILNTQSKVYTVLGFNIKADLVNLANWLNNNTPEYEQLRVDVEKEFHIQLSEFANRKELSKLFINNIKVMKFIRKQMYHANSYYTYSLYKRMYDTLFTSKLNTTHFKTDDGMFANTYTNYIKDRNDILYNILKTVDIMDDKDKNSKISILIDEILTSIDNYLDDDEFDISFTKITNFSSELIREYIYKVIDFFKSYTVQLLAINTIYTIGDKYMNRIQFNDAMRYVSKLHLSESIWDNNGMVKHDMMYIERKQLGISDIVRVNDRVLLIKK